MKRKHRSGLYLVFREDPDKGLVPIETYLTLDSADQAVGVYNQEFLERGLPPCFDVTILSYYDF